MALSAEVLGIGVEFRTAIGTSPETYTKVEKLVDFPEGPNFIADLIEITNHDSLNEQKEFMNGLKDGSEITAVFNDLGTTKQEALKAASGGAAIDCQFALTQFSPEKTLTFPALVRGWKSIPNINGPLQFNVTIKVSGAVVYA